MLFNSIEFALFLPVVFTAYWLLNKKLKLRNIFLVAASYLFYGWWDWRFLSLIAFSSLVDYLVGLGLTKTDETKKRKLLLAASVLVNIGFLGFFKYFNFFAENFTQAFSFFGASIDTARLNIILPVGISFYTFQTLSYSIDVYRRKLDATKDVFAFFAFVSFFPQLVAGPIERATNLLPQFYKRRSFSYPEAVDGMRQILWGLFKKMVIADRVAVHANEIFAGYGNFSGSTLLLGVFFFAVQIYCDFSGYSDIAIGTARLFGFNLRRNFAFPYFSRDIAEFWRRWHISLSTWFRDYVYIPLGDSRSSIGRQIRNTFIIFLVSGFWHGANWTFIMWGFVNALYFIPLMLLKKNRTNRNAPAEGRLLPGVKELVQMLVTFFLTMVAWVFFRAPGIKDAFLYLRGMFSRSLFSLPEILPKTTLAFVCVLIVVEWLQREKQHGLQLDGMPIPKIVRQGLYCAILLMIVVFAGFQQEFIYFQF